MAMRRERKIRQYTPKDLQRALEQLDNGEVNMYQAAKRYKVPRSTLKYYLEDRNRKGRMGPNLTFTEAEEQMMIEWAQDLRQKGMVLRRSDLLEAAQWILETCPRVTKIKDNTPSNSWCRAFERRHPRVSSYLQVESAATVKPPITPSQQCYEQVFQSLNMLEIFNDPMRVYKCYEIGFGLGSNIMKYFDSKGEITKRPDIVTTAIITSAAGHVGFPMVVYPSSEAIPLDLAATVPIFYGCGTSPSGMMTKETLFNYVTKVFYKFLVFNHIKFPVTLFIDGTRPNVSLELWQACLKLQINLVAFNPDESLNSKRPTAHNTLLTRHIKKALSEELLRWKDINWDCTLSESNFTELLLPTVQTGIPVEAILSDWKQFQFYQWILQRKNRVEEIEFVSAESSVISH